MGTMGDSITLNDSTANAIAQLFRNRQYLPIYPFKTILQCLLRDEGSEGLNLCVSIKYRNDNLINRFDVT